ncbi:MFS transporter [Neisseriaceae bacterium ESL0693]|nr:MFS transporter [Neisseriaceae bacterium ESL0693]
MPIPDNLKSTHYFSFVTSRRFLPLFCTQLCNALNDNLFKTAFFVLISFSQFNHHSWLPASQLLNLAAFLFILPYFLFSTLGGEIANKFDKATVARNIKLMELVIMSIAAVGFLLHSIVLLMLCLFLMGTHSALFGPLKYAILPDYLKPSELVSGNGLVESGTFIAILFGQLLGSILAGMDLYWLITGLLLIAIVGQIASLFMLPVAPVTPDIPLHFNIGQRTWQLLRKSHQQKNIWTAIMGISWFWLIGSVYMTQLPTFTRSNLGGDANVFNLMLTLFSVGIGLGSLLCAKFSKGQLHLSLIIPATLGLSIFGCTLVYLTHDQHHVQPQSLVYFLQQAHSYGVMVCILGIGLSGGFFSIPLYTWLQTSSTHEFRTHAIAANNIVNGLFMLFSAVASSLLIWLFDSINLLYLMVAIGNLFMLTYLLLKSPVLRKDCKFLLLKQ